MQPSIQFVVSAAQICDKLTEPPARCQQKRQAYRYERKPGWDRGPNRGEARNETDHGRNLDEQDEYV